MIFKKTTYSFLLITISMALPGTTFCGKTPTIKINGKNYKKQSVQRALKKYKQKKTQTTVQPPVHVNVAPAHQAIANNHRPVCPPTPHKTGKCFMNAFMRGEESDGDYTRIRGALSIGNRNFAILHNGTRILLPEHTTGYIYHPQNPLHLIFPGKLKPVDKEEAETDSFDELTLFQRRQQYHRRRQQYHRRSRARRDWLHCFGRGDDDRTRNA